MNLFALDYDTKYFQDWKEPENRKELFNRYFKWRVSCHDLDHTHYMNILCEDYDYERKAWFAFLFGMTYRTPQAFSYAEIFPYLTETDLDNVEEWHKENWKKTTYGTDARYNKGHFVSQTRSVKEWLGNKTFQQKFNEILIGNSQKENFYLLYKEILTLYKYGRMTGWLTMQALYDLLKLPIDPEEIMIEGFSPNNDSSLQSIWNGLCAYTNNTHKMVGKYGTYTCNNDDIMWAKESLMEYTAAAEYYSGFKIDSFRKESIWCQYKRLFNENESKEYPGHASGDATSRYLYYRNNWPEINWCKFRKALRSQPGYVKGVTYVKRFNEIFGEYNVLLNMNEMFDDMPNVYDILGENINNYKVKEIWTDDGLEVGYLENNISTFKEDIKTTPKWVL